jgi:hypothetical protein
MPIQGPMLAGVYAPFTAYGAAVTWNPSDKAADITLSGSNLIAESTRTDTSKTSVRATAGKTTGCWYWEVTLSQATNTNDLQVGVGDGSFDLTLFLGGSANGFSVQLNGTGLFETGSYTLPNGSSAFSALSAGDKVMCALDMNRGELWVGKNGTWAAGGNPTSRSLPNVAGITGTCYAAAAIIGSGGGTTGGDKLTANFGGTAFSYSPP